MAIPDLPQPIKTDKPESNWTTISDWFYRLWVFVRTPALVGKPTTPTGAPGDASMQIANDAFVGNAVSTAVAAQAVTSLYQGALLGMAGNEGSMSDTGVWIDSFTPVVTAGAGALTSYTAFCRYKLIGKTLYFVLGINITDNGTGTVHIKATLPFTAFAGPFALYPTACGREENVTGRMLQVVLIGNNAYILNYDNTYPATTNANLCVSGVCEII
jgi:hypothetical protein